MNFNGFDFGGLFDIELALESLPFVLGGLPMTLLVSFVGMALGLVLGLFLALARGSNRFIFRLPARTYISFMRGTPMLVFLFILYFGLPVVGIKLTALVAACLGFGLNSAAYIAEIDRSSLNSIDVGQWESAKALNLTYWQTLRKIILPQAMRIAIPPLTNVFMDIVKATSLAAVITVPELFQKTQIIAGREFDAMTMYVLVALIYWPVCILISLVQDRLEKRYSKFV
ncbi:MULTISPECIES: amino acid ABC transporter permease [Virgibacillus]|uniref:Inner membrane amino-acid ABC transporter permease protein YecS n=2 Tax=Virgibacillus TaxID=84406 RepID=A0A024QHP3_9BACI|nr:MULTISPECIES: amino acid ABC transporter permease [Virgibacillus]EQB36855.1 amino acid ABC transporter permease [Virgibacillus sp. CM-4]MYL43034.1 ABC transporter permease subunit [Virgibacillus massiliensis]GGJ65649.1 putative amino-acid ABC transporter permease protein YckA [Virgibacillus kapii]CDQ42058.1 Inner membrane amino-acid ABC transporter permease protein YecS [Virgibacillus massiliensis]